MTPPSARPHSAESSVFVHRALHRRDALRERRPRAVRRHTGRVATRFTVLLVSDVVAILLPRAVAISLLKETVFGSLALPGTPLIAGASWSVFLAHTSLI